MTSHEHSQRLVQKLWNQCKVLRDAGLSYGDYVEQLTYLLFLKMADERTGAPWNEPSKIPSGYDWPSLTARSGPDLEAHYTVLLQELAKQPGLLGMIFRKSQNRVQDPAKLKRLIGAIDEEQWTTIDADVKGDVYEGLLEKNAADTKSGAGQYFTPRALIQAMVDCVQPRPLETVRDPACGTGGFLLIAHDYVANNYALDRTQKTFLRDEQFSGIELVDNTARLCAMNLFLHGIGGASPDATPSIEVRDSLRSEPSEKCHVVLANPPFGRSATTTMHAEDGRLVRDDNSISRADFWATTSNKQLNFVQHIRSMLKINGRAAIVVPDNVLFEGGAGATIRQRLLRECDVHTILRLPTGIFYAQGVKANVVFLERKAASSAPATTETWVYDLRTNQHFTLKTKPMRRADLDDFVTAYLPGRPRSERVPSERFKKWTYDELVARRETNLDIWADLKDEALTDPANLPAPDVLAEEIVLLLEGALEQYRTVAAALTGPDDREDELLVSSD